MELNSKLLEKIKELNVYNDKAKELSSKLENNKHVPIDTISNNAIESLMILNDLFEMEPNVKVRDLHYKYLDFLEKEEYVKCFNVVDELKKIN